jgi:FAD/FMN-containing dehydrogenase
MESFIKKSLIEIKEINEFLRVNCFGHMGDGNLHFNIFPPTGEKSTSYLKIKPKLTDIINNNCKTLEGSFSAEHGVGRLKVKDLKQYCDPGKFHVMCQLKKAMDPLAILNPGVILSRDTQDS